jgi:hypothetical protein
MTAVNSNSFKTLGLGLLSLLLPAVLAPGCTAAYFHGSADQCETDGDCKSRGGSFVSTYCSTDKVCVDDALYCATNSDCVTRNNGDPYRCDKTSNRCIALQSPECTTILADNDDLTNDDYELFGAMMFTAVVPTFQAGQDAIELARQEWKGANGGLAASTVGGPRRPIVVVGCNPIAPNLPAGALEFPTTDQITAAATHLTNDLKVNAIFGPFPGDELATVLTTASLQAQVPLFGMGEASILLNDFPGRGNYLWRLSAGDVTDVTLRAWLVNNYAEQQLRSGANAIPSSTPLRVALMKETGSYGDSGVTVMNEAFTFNGESTTANGANYQVFDYGNPEDSTFPTTFAAAVVNVVAFQPHIIVLWGAGPVAEDEIGQVEAAWPSTVAWRPYHVHGSNLQDPAVVTLVQNDKTGTLRGRTLGVTSEPPQTRAAWATFEQSFYSKYSPATDALDGSGGATYDAAYLTFLAASAVSGPLSGAALAAALPRVNDHTAVTEGPGPVSIPEALGRLSVAGASIYYTGVASPLNCNASHDCDGPMEAIGVQASSPSGFAPIGVYYDADLQKITGAVVFPAP